MSELRMYPTSLAEFERIKGCLELAGYLRASAFWLCAVLGWNHASLWWLVVPLALVLLSFGAEYVAREVQRTIVSETEFEPEEEAA